MSLQNVRRGATRGYIGIPGGCDVVRKAGPRTGSMRLWPEFFYEDSDDIRNSKNFGMFELAQFRSICWIGWRDRGI
jgi:hypothetical protein